MAISHLLALGAMMVYEDPATGEYVVDDRDLEPGRRRQVVLDPVFGDDDFGDDDFGDDDFGDDDLGDDEVSGRKRRGSGRARRQARREDRQDRREDRREDRQDRREKKDSVTTFVGGRSTVTAAGPATISIRLQHDFEAEDITFEGSLAGTLLKSIRFADRLVLDGGAAGIPIAQFGASSFMRGTLQGEKLKGGLDITVELELPGAGSAFVAVKGKKPSYQRC